MGAYTSIRGWIEIDQKSLSKVRLILTDHENRALEFGLTNEGAKFYNQGWVIPEDHINWTHYIFYGADIRTQYVKFVQSQMREIATLLIGECDLEDKDFYYPSGIIHIEEDGTYGHPNEEWRIEAGALLTKLS